jgi:hypothetical protein
MQSDSGAVTRCFQFIKQSVYDDDQTRKQLYDIFASLKVALQSTNDPETRMRLIRLHEAWKTRHDCDNAMDRETVDAEVEIARSEKYPREQRLKAYVAAIRAANRTVERDGLKCEFTQYFSGVT